MDPLAAIVIAALGALGGFAALMKVNADNSKTVSEGATNVVKMMRAQVADLDDRLTAMEAHAEEHERWGDEVVGLLARVIDAMPEPPREAFRRQATQVGNTRPTRRSKAGAA